MGTHKRYKQCDGKSCNWGAVLPLAKQLTVHHDYVCDCVPTNALSHLQTWERIGKMTSKKEHMRPAQYTFRVFFMIFMFLPSKLSYQHRPESNVSYSIPIPLSVLWPLRHSKSNICILINSNARRDQGDTISRRKNILKVEPCCRMIMINTTYTS